MKQGCSLFHLYILQPLNRVSSQISLMYMSVRWINDTLKNYVQFITFSSVRAINKTCKNYLASPRIEIRWYWGNSEDATCARIPKSLSAIIISFWVTWKEAMERAQKWQHFLARLNFLLAEESTFSWLAGRGFSLQFRLLPWAQSEWRCLV